ncbi:SDR family NAD(P)-dependent oxidoreductase [Nocardia sp. NPDC050175]|uniref:SDR family NAD(P)-dependent oxidoreductase n=1 Tax=Nocardia sp. NPDC050175 TaxID=3364317 RepID=UPI00379EF7EC
MTSSLTGRTALITGSTAGIGKAAALLLAGAGAEVIVSGRDTDRGNDTVAQITDGGGRARFVAADLTDPGSLRALADAAGAVDVLVNNAAVQPLSPAVSQDAAGFDGAIAVNLRAPYFLTASIAPAMIARGSGSIVNISSMTATTAMAGFSVYTATKAAMEALTRTWAAEFSPAGVRVNAVSPGPTRTETVLTAVAAAIGAGGEEQLGKLTLLGRMAEPREIAEVILFLADDRSSYLTGAVIQADAGRTVA